MQLNIRTEFTKQSTKLKLLKQYSVKDALVRLDTQCVK